MVAAKASLIGGAVALLALTACAQRQDPVGPWGYNFAIRSIRDVTPDDDVKLMNGTAFRSDQFARSWSKLMPQRVFGSNPAQLDVVVERYEATHGKNSYAVSLETKLRGKDMDGNLLAETPAHCSAVMDETYQLGTFGQQMVDERSLAPLTPAARDATMWQKVLDSCVKDLAIQFGQALAAGRPAAALR
jgi:hypothetical protein